MNEIEKQDQGEGRYHEVVIDGRMRHLVRVVSAKDVTEEVLKHAEDVEEGWFSDAKQIDWEDFWDRLDGYTLDEHEGREIDLGTETDSPAMRKIVKHIQKIRREG